MFQIDKKKFIRACIASAIGGCILVIVVMFIAAKANLIIVEPMSSGKALKNLVHNFNKLPEIAETIENDGVFSMDKEKAGDAVYKAYVSSLGDKYSEYLTKEEAKAWEESLSGEFSGVGINFKKTESGFEVIGTIEDSPASKVDIKAGDLIEKVEGKSFDDSQEMAKAIRGKEGSEVKLTISRDGKSKNFKLVRGTVKEKTVSSNVLEDKLGYIRISGFEEGTAKEFSKELESLEAKGIERAVIDIRSNPGGYTKEGIDIADKLLAEGTITYMEDKKGGRKYYNSDVNRTKIKYAVLVDENTASTAEILAAAIKDNKGGDIIGVTTFGKGIVQNTYKFGDGSALKLTVLQYFSPKGKTINKKGVKPDYEVALPEDASEDLQLNKAIEVLKK